MTRPPYLDRGRIGYLRIHLSRDDWIDLGYLALALGSIAGAVWATKRSRRS